MKFNWTDERLEKLRELWASGMKTMDIGAALGTTKNSAIGKARRLGLPMRTRAHENVARNPGVKQYRAPRQELREMVSVSYGTPKQMIELEPNECRWPIGTPKVGGFHFCGAKTDAYPYCTNHQAVAYIRMRKAR